MVRLYHVEIMCVLLLLLLSACQTEAAPIVGTPEIETSATLPATATIQATNTPEASSTPIILDATREAGFIQINGTIPAGSRFQPGDNFYKSWTILNGGTETWTSGFRLAISSASPAGETLGSPASISLPHEVLPGETIELGVNLTAPSADGRYMLYYHFIDENGFVIANSLVSVSITVGTVFNASSGGVSAELRGAYQQAGETTVDFCLQLPDERAWYPWSVILMLNQEQVSPTGSMNDMARALTDNKCFSFRFPVTAESGTPYQLSVGKVTLPPEIYQVENCARAQNELRTAYPGLDFTCSGGAGMYYSDLVLPTDMRTEQADRLIVDAMSSAIYGPWVLEGVLP